MKPRAGVLATVAVTVGCASALTAPQALADPAAQDCPALFAIGVQSPGQAAADAAASTDSGLLGEVFRSLVTQIDTGRFDRTYLRFQPVMGGVTAGSGPSPYEQSIQRAVSDLEHTATDFLTKCSSSHLVVAGHADGAHVASQFAQQVGRGGSAVPADRIAAVALFSDPTRAPNSPLFPGAAARRSPNPAPGTSGDKVKQLPTLPQQPPTGGGIGATKTTAASFGRLAGRVASFCIAGDLACDTPENAPILKVVSNLVATADEACGDPLRALASVTQALAFTVIKTATTVVNNDVQGSSLASLSLSSRSSLSARLAEASDPRTPLNINDALKAVLKVGTIALNAVTTVVKTLITPANIAEIAAAGLVNPAAGLMVLGQKLLGALPQLVPPTTVSRLVNQAFQAVVSNVSDNAGLIDTTTWVKYSDTLVRRGAYTTNPVAAGGQDPVKYTTAWLTALTHDVADTQSRPTTSSPTTRPTITPSPRRSSTSPAGTSPPTRPPTTAPAASP